MGKRLKWYKRVRCGRMSKGLQSRLNWMDEFCPQKGVEHALDHIGKEGGQQVQKDFATVYYTFRRKGFANHHFTTNLQRGVTVMKKRNIVIHCLVLLMMIATIAACAATRTQSSAGEYVDDSVITTKVKSLLAEDDFLKSFQISVESFKGTVQLSGFVNSQKAVDKAGEIVRSVNGVKSIKNNLIVK
jgi:hypothetical protein